MLRAVTIRAFGVPKAGQLDALGPISIPAPTPGRGQIAVDVVASAVNPADLKVLRGEFAGRFLHARTAPLVTGYDVSGTVAAVGDGVDDLAVGDAVFGHLAYSGSTRQGAFAERVVIDRGAVARKPDTVAHDVAAAAATAGLTALQSMRDKGGLASGGRVLIVGAAGGVGSVAIGVARSLGASVTAVCSTYAVDFVRSLGADDVIDRRTSDVAKAKGPFDVIFDAAAAHGYASLRHLLTPAGGYVTTLPSAGFVGGKILATFSKRRTAVIVVQSRFGDLDLLGSWITGGMKVPIDARFPIRDLRAAIDRVAKGQVLGRVVVDVQNGF
jgi:NADPH:quinone reductase-like Zn-dependent oxidoreductase